MGSPSRGADNGFLLVGNGHGNDLRTLACHMIRQSRLVVRFIHHSLSSFNYEWDAASNATSDAHGDWRIVSLAYDFRKHMQWSPSPPELMRSVSCPLQYVHVVRISWRKSDGDGLYRNAVIVYE